MRVLLRRIETSKIKQFPGLVLSKISSIPSLFLLVILLCSFAPERHTKLAMRTPQIVYLKKIWDKAPHCAFTDITYHKGYFYCIFREAKTHHSTEGFGQVRLIRSKDTASRWESVLTIADSLFDMRDPKITITPKGHLMISYTGAQVTMNMDTGEPEQFFETKVRFSANGTEWTAPEKINIKNEIAWRITWYKGMAYTVGWHKKTGANLYASRDGVNYRKICRFDIKGFPNETSLLFLPNGNMMAVVRNDAGQQKLTSIGQSAWPYDKWTFWQANDFMGGPNAFLLPDSSIITSYRRYMNSGGRFYIGNINTAGKEMNETIEMPSDGDCGYGGMFWKDSALWVSYYSSHEGNTSIYLAKLRLN